MKQQWFAVTLLFFILGLAGSSSAQDQSIQAYQSGNQAYTQRNYDQAIQYYQSAVQQNPNLWQAYQGLGNCYYAKGDKDTALANYQKSLSINPNNPQLSQFVQTIQPQAAPALPASNGAPASNPSETANPSLGGPPNEGINRNLPRQGKIVIELDDSDWIGSWDDLNNIYGGTIASSSTPIGIKLNLGAAYAVSPNFQLGLKVQYLKKTEVSVDTATENDVWDESALGGALEGEGTFPLGDGINFITVVEGGFYTLVGSTITVNVPIYDETGVDNLSGSGPGGMIAAGIEFLMDSKKTWTIDVGMAYQFLSISSITATPTLNGQTGTAFTLQNADGSNASFDFSGLGFMAGVRFF
jgi:hypothetical protein